MYPDSTKIGKCLYFLSSSEVNFEGGIFKVATGDSQYLVIFTATDIPLATDISIEAGMAHPCSSFNEAGLLFWDYVNQMSLALN